MKRTFILVIGVLFVMTAMVTSEELSLSLKEKAVVMEAEQWYSEAIAAYEKGDIKTSRKLFKKAVKRLSMLNPDLQYALNSHFGQMFEELSEYPLESQEPSLDASPKELADAEAKSVTVAPVQELTIPMPVDNALVQKYITLYTKTDRRETLQKAMARSGRYQDMILRILDEHQLPRELLYLPIVESRYNLNDVSWAGASGLWQFMAGTARKYGLQVNFWVDERRDPEKSTRAAARYLKDLYEYFNDWHLALAAYNRGENGIARDLKSTRTTGFDGLSQHKAIPRETENYVPQFVAVSLIAQNLDEYEFAIEYEKPEPYDVVELDNIIDLEVAAKCAETTVQVIQKLNPAVTAWCTPKNYTPYPLRLPAGTKEKFLKNVASVENLTPSRGIVKYKVRRGDYLGRIARDYKTTARAIQETNHIRNPRHLRPGQVLIIQPGRGYWND